VSLYLSANVALAPEDESAQLRFEFETEVKWLEAA
jgi:hypothetical protein